MTLSPLNSSNVSYPAVPTFAKTAEKEPAKKTLATRLKPVAQKAKPIAKRAGREVYGLAKRIVSVALAFTIGMQIRSGNDTVMTASTSQPVESKAHYGYNLYQAGQQHAVDSMKTANYEEQLAKMQQKASQDSIKIAELTKLAKKIKK